MRTLLITGVSGFLGWNLARRARASWQVVGTYFTTKRHIAQSAFAAIETGRIDLTEFREVRDMLAMVKPAAVIHTAALSDANYCETHPNESFRVNVQAAYNLAGLCGDLDIPFVFTSTDLVFDGTKPPYSEADPVTPINIYGEHKAQAEIEILERYELAAICRLPLLYGPSSPTHGSFLQWMIERMRRGEKLSLFRDEYRTPVDAGSAAAGLLMAAASRLPESEDEERTPIVGRLHLGGRERLSRYEFGQIVDSLLRLPEARLEAVSLGDIDLPAQRPPDVSLKSDKAYELGYDPLPVRQALATLFTGEQPPPTASEPEE